MLLQPLINQQRVNKLVQDNLVVNAELLPSAEGKGKMMMRVTCPEMNVDAFLAMANKAELKLFASPESAWKISLKLGIRNFTINNENFIEEKAA